MTYDAADDCYRSWADAIAALRAQLLAERATPPPIAAPRTPKPAVLLVSEETVS